MGANFRIALMGADGNNTTAVCHSCYSLVNASLANDAIQVVATNASLANDAIQVIATNASLANVAWSTLLWFKPLVYLLVYLAVIVGTLFILGRISGGGVPDVRKRDAQERAQNVATSRNQQHREQLERRMLQIKARADWKRRANGNRGNRAYRAKGRCNKN